MPPYGGRVVQSTLGGESIRPGVPVRAGLARDLVGGTAPLTIDLLVGPAPEGLAQLLAIRGERWEELFLLGASGADLVLRHRSRSVGVGLDQPNLVLPGALDGVRPGTTVRLEIHRERRSPTYCATVDGRGRCGLGYSVGSGWRLLLFTEWLPTRLVGALDLVWIALLLLPIGFHARRRLPGAAAALAAAVILFLLPPLVDILPPSAAEMAAAAVGWLLGFALGSAASQWGLGHDRHVRPLEQRQRDLGRREELGAPELRRQDRD
jgi:hypothetical protein